MIAPRHCLQTAISEYCNLLHKLALTDEEVSALKNRAYYFKNKHLYKRCRLCGEIKHIDCFYKNPLKKQKCFDECKECLKQRKKNKKKVDLGFWNKNGEYIEDIQEVDFEKE